MNIIVLTNSLDLGGTERVVAALCNDWAARGDRVTLIATFARAQAPFYPISDVVELIYLSAVVPKRGSRMLSYLDKLRGLRRLMKARAADVIVSFLPNVNVAAILSSAFLKTPVIICERSDPSGYTGFHLLKLLCRLTYRFADMLTVQTNGLAGKARKLYPGVKAVHVIPNALPEEIGCRASVAKGGRKVLLSLGRLAPEKQIGKLVDAFAAIAPVFEDWDLHIYGDGPLLPALQAQIRDAGLQTRVFLKGPTGSPWEVMAHADTFAMLSQYEGFPNALLEAMGIGLPCVVFDCPSGPREITRDGKDALLVPLNDFRALQAAMRQLMGDPDLRLALGQQACESVRDRFGHRQVMAQWDELFVHVGAGARAPDTGRRPSARIDRSSAPARSS
jgi:glycosyltransferase involved in cell wall biosynthesis